MTADARRDEALRVCDEAIAICEAATRGPWVENVLGSEGYDVRANADPTGNPMRRIRVARFGYEKWETDKANAIHVAYHDPKQMLHLHRANKVLLEEHRPRRFDSMRDLVYHGATPELFESILCASPEHGYAPPWPCPTAARVIDAYLGDTT